jgi:hypothetical protein
LKKFKVDPVEGAPPLLQLRRQATINEILADAEFMSSLKRLASEATKSSKAALLLSRFALRSEFSSAAAVAIGAGGSWTEPSNFAAEHRRQAADALERARPPWALLWLAKALLSALPYADLRRFFASRLLLASGGLAGAVGALSRSLRALQSQGKKGYRDRLTLIRELRSCATPAAAVESSQTAFMEFIRTVRSDPSATDDPEIKLELAHFILEAAAADRGLLLTEELLAQITTLNADVASELRTAAAKLLGGREKAASGKPSTDQVTLIREAAWADADRALGLALQDMGRLARSFERLESAVDGEAADRARHAKAASDFVLQWVWQAADKRSLKALNAVGEQVSYDPALHDVDDEASAGDHVRVVKPPIVRGGSAQQVVVVRGKVEPD